VVLGQRLRRRQVRVCRQHRVDVVVQRDDALLGVDRVKPDMVAVKQQQSNVGKRARTEAAALGEVYLVAQPSPLPLLMVQVCRHRGVTVVGTAAAATRRADEELPLFTGDVDELSVFAIDEIACYCVRSLSIQRGSERRSVAVRPVG